MTTLQQPPSDQAATPARTEPISFVEGGHHFSLAGQADLDALAEAAMVPLSVILQVTRRCNFDCDFCAHLAAQRDWLAVERLPAYAPELNPAEYLWANLKGGALANCTGDTIAEVADQAHHGIQRVCDSDSLVVGFLAHTGLSLDTEPSP
jgi:hypothetical protein